MTIQDVLKMPEYKFIFENEHLKNKIMFLTFGGSYAYGTNKEGSDIDIRGVCLNSPEEIIGIKTYDQFLDNNTDTTIYAFNRIVKLLTDCNPNTIEMLGCKPEHYAMVSPLGKMLLDNADLFISQRAFYSFSGYANSQLRRLQNAVARDRVSQELREQHIKGSLETMANTLETRYSSFDRDTLRFHIGDSTRPGYTKEVMVDMTLKDYPARELNSVLNEITNVVRDYDKLGHRNHKKDEAHLNKHAMHLVRLYLMCFDIVKDREVVTYREKEHDFLMSIRNGYFMNEDGTYKKEFFDIIDDYDKQLEHLLSVSTLPERPDMEKINQLVMNINKQTLDILM
jgi:predicted nucleotidyltransferase